MRIQTFSVVVGSAACNARCPFCVSRMTPRYSAETREPAVNWRNFEIACRFAKDSGVSTVLITGKGEPTLFPEQVTQTLERLRPFGFPFVELQTNGIALADPRPRWAGALARWYEQGLTLVALSVVHHEVARNREIYRPGDDRYPALPELVGRLHAQGLAVRLSCVLLAGQVDSPEALAGLIAFCKGQGVEQLTVRPVQAPAASLDPEVARWVAAQAPPAELVPRLRAYLDARGTRLMELLHGAVVYDVEGQNVCLSSCLTLDPRDERIRQLIFFPDGHLRYDWQYPGAILL